MGFPLKPVLCGGSHLTPGLPPCFCPLSLYCAPPGCFWPASPSLPLRSPCQGCNTVVIRMLSKDVSNETPSPSDRSVLLEPYSRYASFIFESFYFGKGARSNIICQIYINTLQVLSIVHALFYTEKISLSKTVSLENQLSSATS